MKNKPCYLPVIFIFSLLILKAQSQKIIVNKIIAQVGDKIILASDIDTNACYGGSPELHSNCALFEAQVFEKALFIEARDNSLMSNTQLEALLDNEVQRLIQQYGGKKAFELNAGKTIYQVKERIRQPFIERALIEAMREKLLAKVNVSPKEVKAYFDSLKPGNIPLTETTLEAAQIVIYPQPTEDVERYTTNQLLVWKAQVEDGKAKFDTLAKLYSQDPASNMQGGIYSINKNDKRWDPAWFEAIWKLREGEISNVVKSKYGLHIIQMVSREGDDAVIRDILLIPLVTNSEISQATALLDSIRLQIISGHISFRTAAGQFNEDGETRMNAGQITGYDGNTLLTIDELDNDASLAIRDMNNGEISKPTIYKDDRQRTAVRIIFLKRKTLAHKENLKGDYEDIARQALEKKRNEVLQKWFISHLHNYSLEIAEDYANCDNIIALINKVEIMR